MFKFRFVFEPEWLARHGDDAAQIALCWFEQGEPDALIQLSKAKFSLRMRYVISARFFYASPIPLLRAVAAATRKKPSRKSGWRKYPQLWPVIAGLYQPEEVACVR